MECKAEAEAEWGKCSFGRHLNQVKLLDLEGMVTWIHYMEIQYVVATTLECIAKCSVPKLFRSNPKGPKHLGPRHELL